MTGDALSVYMIVESLRRQGLSPDDADLVLCELKGYPDFLSGMLEAVTEWHK